jgi:hypothetical protein
VTLNRYAAKRDATEGPIIDAIEKAGWYIWPLDRPVDLLCFKPGMGFRCLEVKGKTTPVTEGQKAFCELTGAAIVRTPLEALEALGEYNPRGV